MLNYLSRYFPSRNTVKKTVADYGIAIGTGALTGYMINFGEKPGGAAFSGFVTNALYQVIDNFQFKVLISIAEKVVLAVIFAGIAETIGHSTGALPNNVYKNLVDEIMEHLVVYALVALALIVKKNYSENSAGFFAASTPASQSKDTGKELKVSEIQTDSQKKGL